MFSFMYKEAGIWTDRKTCNTMQCRQAGSLRAGQTSLSVIEWRANRRSRLNEINKQILCQKMATLLTVKMFSSFISYHNTTCSKKKNECKKVMPVGKRKSEPSLLAVDGQQLFFSGDSLSSEICRRQMGSSLLVIFVAAFNSIFILFLNLVFCLAGLILHYYLFAYL